jgi:hypothetical protein
VVATRAELMAGYQHPYRRWLPVAWRQYRVARSFATTLAVVVACVVVTLVLGGAFEFLAAVVAVMGALAAFVNWAQVTIGAALVTWSFRPLDAEEDPRPDEQLIRGRPRYGATIVERRPFDPVDAARAAEQLAIAQEDAAALEAALAQRALRRLADEEAELELSREAASTARALRRVTGQSRD